MLTLKETIIDLADCHFSLAHLSSPPVGGSLIFSNGKVYAKLYERIAAQHSLFEDLAGQGGKVLRRLKPVFHDNSYWKMFFNMAMDSWSLAAWKKLAPIEGRLNFRLSASCPPGMEGVKVSPVPRVLLYPFGWSIWISVRVTQSHSLEDLSRLVQHLAKGKAYSMGPESKLQTLDQIRAAIASGVREDVFGGQPELFAPPDVLSVVTVLNKSGGFPPIKALDPQIAEALRILVSPRRGPSTKSWEDLVRNLKKAKEGAGISDYVLQDDFGVFIWADHLLKPEGRNHKHLRCYHNNTFLSLLHAWQVSTLLSQAASLPKKKSPLRELMAAGLEQIDEQLNMPHSYRNVCLLSFLKSHSLNMVIQKAQASLRPSQKLT